MITDRIGRHEVLLPINHNCNKIWCFRLFLKLKHKKIQEFFFLLAVKKSHLSSHVGWRVLSYYTVLLVLKSGQLVANQIWEFFVVMISRKICPFVAKLIFSCNQAKEDEFLKNAFVCYSPAVSKRLMWLYAIIAYNHMYHVIRFLCTFQVAF